MSTTDTDLLGDGSDFGVTGEWWAMSGANSDNLSRLASDLQALECRLQDNDQAIVWQARYALEALDGALSPSAATKAAYIGEFTFDVPTGWDKHGNETWREVDVPWCTIKEIMAGIRASANADIALASGIEARSDATTKIGAAEGESPTGEAGDAQ